MSRSFIDISMPLCSGMFHWPSDPAVEIELFKGPEKGDRSVVSKIIFGSHTGTHIDAPRHYIPESLGVDEIPFENLIGACQVVDCRKRKTISIREVRELQIEPAPRVLFRTDNSEKISGEKVFFTNFTFLEPEAAEWLAVRGVKLIGIDGLSIDEYHSSTAGSHMALLNRGITVVEGLNMNGVEAGRYDLLCLPLRFVGVDGAPARAVLVKEH